jgi:Alginate export
MTPLLLLLSLAHAADNPVALGVHAQVRPRFEFNTGRDGAAGAEAFTVSQRTRFGVNAALPRLELRATFQDVRMWGSETHTLLDFSGDTMDLHEGWVAWRPVDPLSLKAGRQEIVLHEHRLIGNVDWAQQGRAFDALTARVDAGMFSADAGAAVLADTDSGIATTNALMAFVRAGVRPTKASQADLLAVVDHDETAERTRLTGGFYGQAAAGSLSGRVEAYGQMGSASRMELQAGMIGVRGTWAAEAGVKPSVTLWYDLLSGDDDATDTKSTTFDTLFATNHKFYGLMDIAAFTVGGAIDGQGLHDGALKLGLKPTDKLNLNLDAHLFAAAAPAGDDALIGEEVDLWASGALLEKLTVSGGASTFLWADQKKEPDAWVWLQVSAEL